MNVISQISLLVLLLELIFGALFNPKA
uniref:Uncharacterized protein n=1 Tax=Anguilla anguilla TaxID=7936 RepID=A0A0E9U0I5_ANGAN